MRILLILPADKTYSHNGVFRRSISYAPLTLTTLAALVPDDMHAIIDIVDEGVQKPDYDRKQYDIVGITCVASSSARAYALCQYWRSKGAFVVLGGVHPTLMPDEASTHADCVVSGLAENTWPLLLRDFVNGKTKRYYRHLPIGQVSCPTPRRDLQPSHLYLPVPTVIANRSCLNHCEFCSIHGFFDRNSVTRPIEEVIDEIRSLRCKRFILLDPCPDSARDYAKEFFEALIPLKVKWAGLSTVGLVRDKELFDLVVRSGCQGLLMGFESLTQSNVTTSHKPFNKVRDYREVVRALHQKGISVLGCFVLGFDGDTSESLAEMATMVEELEVDLPRYSVLTPFPGTELFARLEKEGRILTRDWSLYDTEHVVFQAAMMHPVVLQQALSDVWKQSYSIGKIAKRVSNLRSNRLFGLAASLGFHHYAHKVPGELPRTDGNS